MTLLDYIAGMSTGRDCKDFEFSTKAMRVALSGYGWGFKVLRVKWLCQGFSMLLVLGGCAIQGEQVAIRRPALTVPDQWSISSSGETLSFNAYWRELGDPLINRLVTQALAANRDLDRAVARLTQARAGLRASRANYLPRIVGTAGAQRDIGTRAERDVQFSLGADAQWELDIFGQIGNDVKAARADLAGAGYGLADLQRLIVGQVAQTVISARALAAQLVIARDTLRLQEDNLQIAQWRLQAGLVSSLDVEQARAQRAQTAATIPALERDLAQAANTLSTLIGEAPGSVRRAFTEDTAPVPSPPASAGFEAPAAVLRRRPDIRQAEAALAASAARIAVARAQLFPLVRLSGTLNSASIGSGGLFDIITGGLVAGVSQLIFDGGRTRAQIEGARAIAADALAAWEQAVLQALADVESADAALTAGRERVALLATASDSAQNAALLARSQYQAGLIDFLTLLTAENQLLSARTALTASEAERANAYVSLGQALGGGWDEAEIARVIDRSEGEPAR